MLLKRLIRKRPSPGASEPQTKPEPTALTYVIGDIHGCRSLLDTLLALIAQDAGSTPHHIVTVGDYVDRGPDSKGVLALLLDLTRQDPSRYISLLGNHDQMLLDFLSGPEPNGFWLRIGGADTLASFGVAEPRGVPRGDIGARLRAQSDALNAAVGDDLIEWLSQRPLWWQTGNVIAVHALTNPSAEMAEQEEETLLWARPDSETRPRFDGTWVVHGHTIVEDPRIQAGHVAVDTGAFRSGRLSAAVFAPSEPVRFLQTATP